MTCTVGDFVDLATQQLNDEDQSGSNCTWSRPLIRRYIQLAVSAVVSFRPDLFTVTKEITLKPGCLHYICEDCDQFNSVVSVDGNDCAIEAEPSDYGNKLSKRYKQLSVSCSSDDTFDAMGSYTHGGISYDANNPCYFKTTNEVPARGVQATISCSKAPSTDSLTVDDAPLPPKVCSTAQAAVLEYVMYLALEKDHEIDVAQGKLPMHFNNFVTLLNLQVQGTERYQSDADS